MTIGLHNISKAKSARKRVRVGRGDASGKGTYSGRGLKGQRSRSGGKGGLKLRGFKQNLLNFPKFKGMSSLKPNNQVVNLDVLEEKFNDGDTVSPVTLLEKKITSKLALPVKILSKGELSKKLEVVGCLISVVAKEAVEKAGGSVVPVTKKPALKKKEIKASK